MRLYGGICYRQHMFPVWWMFFFFFGFFFKRNFSFKWEQQLCSAPRWPIPSVLLDYYIHFVVSLISCLTLGDRSNKKKQFLFCIVKLSFIYGNIPFINWRFYITNHKLSKYLFADLLNKAGFLTIVNWVLLQHEYDNHYKCLMIVTIWCFDSSICTMSFVLVNCCIISNILGRDILWAKERVFQFLKKYAMLIYFCLYMSVFKVIIQVWVVCVYFLYLAYPWIISF